MSFCVVGARDCALCQNWAKREGFVAVSKTLAGVGHWKRICKDAFRVAGAVQETCSSEMSGSQGADFLRGVSILEPQICRFAEMILPDRCSTSYDLALIFRGRRNTLDRWAKKSQNALVRGRQLCTQLFIFEGSLAEFFCFWCRQLRKMKKSCRIALFLMLSSWKIEEVSQIFWVFDGVKFKNSE